MKRPERVTREEFGLIASFNLLLETTNNKCDEWEKFIDDFVYKTLPEIMKQAINSEDAEDSISNYLRGE